MTENVIEISDDDDEVICISSDEDSYCPNSIDGVNKGGDGLRKVPLINEDLKNERSLSSFIAESVIGNGYWETQNMLFSRQKLKIEGVQKRKCFAKFSVKSFKNKNSSVQEVKKSTGMQVVPKTDVIDYIDLTDDVMDDSKVGLSKENKPLEQISSSVLSDNLKKYSFPKIAQVEMNSDVCDSIDKNIFERLMKTKSAKDSENNSVLVEKSDNVLKATDQHLANKTEFTSPLQDVLKVVSVQDEGNSLKTPEKRMKMNDEDDVLPVAKKRRNFMDVFRSSYTKTNKLLQDDLLKCTSNDISTSIRQNNIMCHLTKSLFTHGNPGNIFSRLYRGTNETLNNCADLNLNLIPLSLQLPKPIQYHKCQRSLKRVDTVCDFSENLSSIIEAGLEGGKLHLNASIHLITSLTTTKSRPDYRFIKEIFDRFSSKTTCLNEFKIYHRALLFIHELHELPSHLPLWDYIESAYFIDMIESHEADLVIKSTVFDTIVYFVEASIVNLNSSADVYAVRNTLAYKLLSLDKYKGNIKTFFGWLEDTLKSYCESKNNDKWEACKSLYSIIISLQKLLAIALIVTKYHAGNVDRMVSEYAFIYNRLNTLEQQKLLLETIGSDLIRLHLCEILLERLGSWADVQNEEKLISQGNSICSMEKIVKYYFQLDVVISPNSWSPNRGDKELPEAVTHNNLERILHILVLLQRSYLNVRELYHLRNHSSLVSASSLWTNDRVYIQSLSKHVNQLEARLTKSFPTVMPLPKFQQLFLMLRLEALRIS